MKQLLGRPGERGGEALEAHLDTERLCLDLQELVMKARMVPLGPVFRQYVRTVRDVAAAQGKLARLAVEGEEVEVDTSVVEHIRDPLTHLIRNALDHGVEAPDVRRHLGKDPCACVTLRASHRAGSILIELTDDGGGLDRGRIAARARERGLADEHAGVRPRAARSGAAHIRMIQLDEALGLLSRARVEFVVVGGVAAIAHGSARLTFDLDVVYARDEANIERLAAALAPVAPYLRGAPPGLPFRWDAETIRRGLNLTLTSEVGDIDLIGEAAGGGTYAALLPHSRPLEAFGVRFQCVDLERLIQLKRAPAARRTSRPWPNWRRCSRNRARIEAARPETGRCPCSAETLRGSE
jgi:hypothetical protein